MAAAGLTFFASKIYTYILKNNNGRSLWARPTLGRGKILTFWHRNLEFKF
jgi:hypothetical protein